MPGINQAPAGTLGRAPLLVLSGTLGQSCELELIGLSFKVWHGATFQVVEKSGQRQVLGEPKPGHIRGAGMPSLAHEEAARQAGEPGREPELAGGA